MATIKNWFNEFQRGRTSVFDEPRPGALKTATTEDSVKKIHDLVLADRRLKVREIAETVGGATATSKMMKICSNYVRQHTTSLWDHYVARISFEVDWHLTVHDLGRTTHVAPTVHTTTTRFMSHNHVVPSRTTNFLSVWTHLKSNRPIRWVSKKVIRKVTKKKIQTKLLYLP